MMNGSQHLLDAFHSLSDATRLRLLALLDNHELGVAELCEILQMPQSTVSRHLKVLADRGWIRSRSHKTANLYRMYSTPELPESAADLWAISKARIEGWTALEQDRLRLQPVLQRHRADTFFAHAAQRWQAMRAELYGHSFNAAALGALLGGDTVVADLACGTGELAALMARHVRCVYGIDSSEEMLKEARGRTEQLDNVELMLADLQDLPLPNQCCDAALMLLALTYVEKPGAALNEMARILRPGGRAVLITLLEHDRDDFRIQLEQLWPGFAVPQLLSLMRTAGFTEIDCGPLPAEHGVKGPALILATGITPGLQIS